MKWTSYFDKIDAGGILLLAVFLLGALTGCGKDNEPGGENRKGEPYKFRIEVSAEKPDVFDVLTATGHYNYIDENGLPRTIWYTPDDVERVPSPDITEIEVPSNFYAFMFTSSLISIDLSMPFEEELQGIISGKIFVNNKLLAEFSNKFWWITTIAYDNKTKQYTVKTSDGKEFKTSKLD
jgi:hypothetical protein